MSQFANGVNGVKGSEALEWKMGLLNQSGKYLTAETFGCKINASGTNLRKKQLWILEHDQVQDSVVYIRSHLNRYLSCSEKGVVRCDVEKKGEKEQFVIEYGSDLRNKGKWAIRNEKTGLYFQGEDDNLFCDKAPH